MVKGEWTYRIKNDDKIGGKVMKKISAILLTILMVFSLAACGGKSESAEETAFDTGDTTEAASTETASKETEQHDDPPENGSTEESTVDIKTEIPYDGVFPEHEPYGTGIGAMPGGWSGRTTRIPFRGMEAVTGGRQTILMKRPFSRW